MSAGASDFEWFQRNRDLICKQIKDIRNHVRRFETSISDDLFYMLWDKVQFLRSDGRNYPIHLNNIINRIEEMENYSAEEWELFGQIHKVDENYIDTLYRVREFVKSYYHPGFDNK